MIKSKLSCCIVTLFLCACTSKTSIIFHEIEPISVDQKVNTCTFVKSVDGEVISAFNYDGNQIVIENKVIKCPSVDTSKMGKQTITFYYDDKEYTLQIEVVDNQPPIFDKEVNAIELELFGNEKMILDYFLAEDHDKKITWKLEGDINYDKVGVYPIKVIVSDSSDNKNEKEVVVTVKEKQEVKKEETQDPNKVPVLPDLPPKDEGTTNSNSVTQVTAVSKTFLFSDGYDYSTCYEASVNYAKSMIAQKKANGYECNPIRNEREEYIGYKVIFK